MNNSRKHSMLRLHAALFVCICGLFNTYCEIVVIKEFSSFLLKWWSFNLVENLRFETHPNIKSIQLCKFCETNSDSRALRCIEMKSSGDLAHGGKTTSSTRSFVFCSDPRSNLKKSRFLWQLDDRIMFGMINE